MSNAFSIPYKLRPNKAVDRELFIALLVRLAATLKVENYRYIGLGGPFLEDFRLIHARLGINEMVCVEVEESVHKRQMFNRPIPSIECIHQKLEDYLDSTEFEKPVIIWFDYTDPREMTEQIERFAQTIGVVPQNSILKITLNASPSTLGEPKQNEISASVGGQAVQEWRLARFQEKLGGLFPSGLKAEGMTYKNFGESVLTALYLAVERIMLSFSDREARWALATHYADGQPMVTATLVVVSRGDHSIERLLGDWCYSSSPRAPLKLDIPILSTIERLTMESTPDSKERMAYELPKSALGEDPYVVFKQLYRVYPQFARVDF